MLYEESLDKILSDKWQRINETEKKRTSIQLPQWLRIALVELKEIYNLNWSELTNRMIQHGFSIVEHECNEEIKLIGKYRKSLRFAKLEIIRNFFTDFSVSVDGLDKTKNKSFAVKKNVFSGIVETGEKLGIDMSSMIRLCFYHSILRTDKIPVEITHYALIETEKFKRKIKERSVVMKALIKVNDAWDVKNE